MKVKVLQFVPRQEIGTLVDLHPGDVIALDDAVAQKLIDNGKAEFEI